MIASYRHFKKRHRIAHLLVISTTLVLSWWGVWGLLDVFFFPDEGALRYVLAIAASSLILYIDGFHLRELE